MKNGFAFATYVTLEDVVPQNTIVYLGQGKSLFMAKFTKVDENADKDFEKEISAKLRPGVFYCFSDAFVDGALYDDTMFAISDFKDYRAYATSYATDEKGNVFYKNIKKDSCLYKLVKTGSIFISKKDAFVKKFDDERVKKIGFNILLNKTEE